MIGVHVTFTIKPGGVETFLEWKRREGMLHAVAPGFLKRSMTRSADNPNVFYFVTLWETQEQIDAFKASTIMNQTIADVGVSAVIESREVVTVTEVFDQRLGETPAAILPG
jgi:heme-degrading monooxygenase HmoA